MTAPHSYFLPPKLLLSTSRLLLSISLSPHFFVTQSSSSGSTTFFNATSAAKGVDIACESNTFRRGIISCLQAIISTGGGAEGLVDRAVEVWRRGSVDRDEEVGHFMPFAECEIDSSASAQVKRISIDALSTFSRLIHPSLPPLQINSTFARLKAERVGGSLGDDIDLKEGAEEFAPVNVEVEEVSDDVDMEVDVVRKEVKQLEVAVAPASVPKSTFAASSNASFATFGTTFSTPFAIAPATPVALVAAVASSSFIVAPPQTAIARPTPVVRQDIEPDEDSDDEGMPEIDMRSDDDEE